MKNEYRIDWPLVKKWTRENQFRGARLVFFIIWCVMLVVSIGGGIFSIAISLYYNAILLFMAALVCFYQAFFRNLLIARQQFKRLCEIYGKDSWIASICFNEDEIVVKEEKSEARYAYSDVQKISEKKDHVELELRAKSRLRLYPSKFVDCTWEDCKARLLQKNPLLQ